MTGDTPPLPDDTGIGRVALRVTDLDTVVGFYRDVIGLTVQSRDDGGATLGAGDEALLELIADPDARERPRDATGLFHTAFLVPSRQALADALVRIEAHTDLTGASDHLVSEALYLTDPEGNGIEVYRDRPRSEWPREDDGVGMDTLPLDLGELREQGQHADAAPDDTTVGHVHLEVSDIAAARTFYVDQLGFDLMQTYGDSALFVSAGGYHHHVGLNVWNGRSAPPSGRGLAWFEVTVPDDDRVAALRDRLAAGDGTVEPTENGFAITDPDDISLRVSRA